MSPRMRRGPTSAIVLIGVGAVLMAACALPLRFSDFGQSTPPPPVELRRCDDVQDVLCVLTFGLEPPDQMLILLLAEPGLPEELAITVTRDAEKMTFACLAPAESPTVVYCTGPQVSLGSTLIIEVFAVQERVLLASGRFTLNALAMPTVPAGGAQLPAPGGASTPQATRPAVAGSPTPGTAYPNATPNSPPSFPPISPP